MSLIVLGDRRTTLDEAYAKPEGPAAVRQALLKEASCLNHHGVNHWRVLLYKTLADHEEFCDGGFEIIKRLPKP
jgi:hypothetical protein